MQLNQALLRKAWNRVPNYGRYLLPTSTASKLNRWPTPESQQGRLWEAWQLPMWEVGDRGGCRIPSWLSNPGFMCRKKAWASQDSDISSALQPGHWPSSQEVPTAQWPPVFGSWHSGTVGHSQGATQNQDKQTLISRCPKTASRIPKGYLANKAVEGDARRWASGLPDWSRFIQPTPSCPEDTPATSPRKGRSVVYKEI